jgi:hypothetical protein
MTEWILFISILNRPRDTYVNDFPHQSPSERIATSYLRLNKFEKKDEY